MRNKLPDPQTEPHDEDDDAVAARQGERPDQDSSGTDDESDGQASQENGGRSTGAGSRKIWRIGFPSSRRGQVLLAGMTGLVLTLGGGGLAWQSTGLPEGAAFSYGDHVVSQDELDARVQSLQALYGVVPPADPGKLNGFRRDVAKSVAVSMILDQAGGERKIVVSDKQARDVLDRYIAGQFGEGGRDAFVRSLGNVGTSERAVLDEIKRQITVGRLMDQVIGHVSTSDDELRREFDKRKHHLGLPERRVVRNVVVGSAQDGGSVLDELKAGAPFEAVAAQRSLDGSTKQSGGMLGELTRDQLEGPVADAAFVAAQGSAYGPVPGRFGWNVGRVDQVLAPVPPNFEQVRDHLRQTLHTERSVQRWRAWLNDQIRAADVEYAPAYQPANPDAAPDAAAPGTPDGTPNPGNPPR